MERKPADTGETTIEIASDAAPEAVTDGEARERATEDAGQRSAQRPATNPPPSTTLEALLESVDAPDATPEREATSHPAHETSAQAGVATGGGLRAARLLSIAGRRATICYLRATSSLDADIAPEVDAALLEAARTDRQLVLVDAAPGERPMIVGVLQTRLPSELRLRGEVVHIEGEREVLLRSGRAGVRLRADGDVEIVGSRIHAASRGLFKLVGRILRLN